MTRAMDVLMYINETMPPTGEVQYQKLLYYVQAWSLAWDGEPMFEDRIEAWAMGPVVPNTRHCLGVKGQYRLTSAQRDKIDAVVKYYRRWTGGDLIDKTHAERPWLEARGDLPTTARSTAEITFDSMLCEFTLQSLTGDGPKRPQTPPEDAEEAEALALASLASRRWSRTLALLAE